MYSFDDHYKISKIAKLKVTTKINVLVIRYFLAIPETNDCILRRIRHLAEKTQAIMRDFPWFGNYGSNVSRHLTSLATS